VENAIWASGSFLKRPGRTQAANRPPSLTEARFHVVATASDAECWDSVSPILYYDHGRTRTGNPKIVADCLPSLSLAGVNTGIRRVLVSCRILQWFLREQGHLPRSQAYLSHDLFEFSRRLKNEQSDLHE